MFTGERKNWILGWFFNAYYGRKVLEKWLEPKNEKLAKRRGESQITHAKLWHFHHLKI